MIKTSDQSQLLAWYGQFKRDFPWRKSRDPYRIWVSEAMLQQTTTTAVVPYFERFIERFPTLTSLATAPVEDVLQNWAGLGYYSRARNLHKAAQALNALDSFPRSHNELLEMPGFGPYTARAVASLAFDEPVGVVDGNTIRVLARFLGRDWEWWKTSTRQEIQACADRFVQGVSSSEMNQALMELGRTVCTPKSPSCLLCPIQKNCLSRRDGRVNARPKSKPRREREIWHWVAELRLNQGRLALTREHNCPFLKGQLLLPGRALRLKRPPKEFHYRHSVTHHDIFVTVSKPADKLKDSSAEWIRLEEITRHAPTSLLQKAIAHHASSGGGVRAKANRSARSSDRQAERRSRPGHRRQ